jgi:hypothetical protein
MNDRAGSRWAWPPRRWPGGLAWGLWALTLGGLAGAVWLDRLLRQDGFPELAFLGGGSTAAAMTPPAPWTASRPASATRST